MTDSRLCTAGCVNASRSVIPLKDAWARRRFVIAYRDRDALSKASLMLLDYLVAAARGDG